jgi:hypothetical protein
MDRSFVAGGMKLLGTSYASPQFERAAAQANSWEGKFSFLRGLLNRCENIPGLRALTGVSMLKAYQKPGTGEQYRYKERNHKQRSGISAAERPNR